jgi:hypothetical protein
MVDRMERRPMESLTRTFLRHTVQRVSPEWITMPIDVLARAMCLNTFIKDRPSIEILDNQAIFRLSEQQPLINKEQSNVKSSLLNDNQKRQ